MDNASQSNTEARVVQIEAGPITLPGILELPAAPRGVVLFVHGSGSSRHSPRNRLVAEQLHDCDLATMRFDLLVEGDADDDLEIDEPKVDVELLGQRVVAAVDWLAQDQATQSLPLGCFGSGTGAAAALIAAAERPERVGALVLRGGRPDLAGLALSRVKAPTLLIVGGSDYPIVSLNRDALQVMSCERSLEVVPGATHLFEENEALAHVARLAGDWYTRYILGEARNVGG